MGAFSIFTTTMASANSLATFDLGGAWHYNYLIVPTMTSGANIEVWGTVDSATTYFQIRQQVAATTTAQMPSFIVAATCAANGAIVPLLPGYQYLRLRVDSAPTAATVFKIACGAHY